MNTAEKVYHSVQDLPEPYALEVLHFVEFLKAKQKPNETTVAAIHAGERDRYEEVSLDDLRKQ